MIENLESTETQTNFTPTCSFCDKDDNDSDMKLPAYTSNFSSSTRDWGNCTRNRRHKSSCKA